jgi:hypothetical protein
MMAAALLRSLRPTLRIVGMSSGNISRKLLSRHNKPEGRTHVFGLFFLGSRPLSNAVSL